MRAALWTYYKGEYIIVLKYIRVRYGYNVQIEI